MSSYIMTLWISIYISLINMVNFCTFRNLFYNTLWYKQLTWVSHQGQSLGYWFSMIQYCYLCKSVTKIFSKVTATALSFQWNCCLIAINLVCIFVFSFRFIFPVWSKTCSEIVIVYRFSEVPFFLHWLFFGKKYLHWNIISCWLQSLMCSFRGVTQFRFSNYGEMYICVIITLVSP